MLGKYISRIIVQTINIKVKEKKHQYSFFSDSAKVKKERGSENTWLNYEDRKTYALMLYNDTGVTNLTVPFSYVKHLNFLNFEEFNIINPIWVNMVRHPVERVVSWFYYTRQAWYLFIFNWVYIIFIAIYLQLIYFLKVFIRTRSG